MPLPTSAITKFMQVCCASVVKHKHLHGQLSSTEPVAAGALAHDTIQSGLEETIWRKSSGAFARVLRRAAECACNNNRRWLPQLVLTLLLTLLLLLLRVVMQLTSLCRAL